ncbi:serine hydrolase, partial [Actinosynnema sp. NPDC059797]
MRSAVVDEDRRPRGRRQVPEVTVGVMSRHTRAAPGHIAGVVVERVTGRSCAQEITHRVLRPLGLRNTS